MSGMLHAGPLMKQCEISGTVRFTWPDMQALKMTMRALRVALPHAQLADTASSL